MRDVRECGVVFGVDASWAPIKFVACTLERQHGGDHIADLEGYHMQSSDSPDRVCRCEVTEHDLDCPAVSS